MYGQTNGLVCFQIASKLQATSLYSDTMWWRASSFAKLVYKSNQLLSLSAKLVKSNQLLVLPSGKLT